MKRNAYLPFILLLMIALVMNATDVRADNLEEFKAAVKRYNESLVHWEVDIIADIEAEAFGFTFREEYLTNNKLLDKELWKQQTKELRSQYEYYDMTVVISLANVVGTTGFACGTYKISRKHREYPWVSAKKRWSSTWAKTNGEWKLVFYHFELIEAWR
jgi:hypothetical protein